MKKNKKIKTEKKNRIQSRGFSFTVNALDVVETEKKIKDWFLYVKDYYEKQVLMCGWFLHNKDIYTQSQIDKYEIKNVKAGDKKPEHFHISILFSNKKDLSQIEKIFCLFWKDEFTAGKIVCDKNCYSGRYANEKDFSNKMKYWFHWGVENLGKTVYEFSNSKNSTTFIYGINWETFLKYVNSQEKDLIENETFDDELEDWEKIGYQVRHGKISLADVENKYWGWWSKHKRYFCDCFADYVEAFQKPSKHKFNLFFFGEGGTGKTFLCNYLAEKIFEKSKIFPVDDLKSGFNGLRTETCLIFNDVNSTGDNSIKQNLSLQVFKNVNDLHNQSMRVKVLYKTIKIFPEMCFWNCSEKANLFFEKLCAKSCETITDEYGNEKKIFTAENKKQFTRRFPWGWDTDYFEDGNNLYAVYSLLNGNFKTGNWDIKNKVFIKWELDEDNNATPKTLELLKQFGDFLFTCWNPEKWKFEWSKLNFDKLKIKTDICYFNENHYYFS